MEVDFYSTTDNPRVINKTLQLIKTLNIVFRHQVDDQAPEIIMSKDNLGNANYVYIPAFDRYYFINDVSYYTSKLVTVSLTTDVLMTYQDMILNSQMLITATENPSYLSKDLPVQTTTSKRIVKSDTTLEQDNSLILTTVGGTNKGAS